MELFSYRVLTQISLIIIFGFLPLSMLVLNSRDRYEKYGERIFCTLRQDLKQALFEKS